MEEEQNLFITIKAQNKIKELEREIKELKKDIRNNKMWMKNQERIKHLFK